MEYGWWSTLVLQLEVPCLCLSANRIWKFYVWSACSCLFYWKSFKSEGFMCVKSPDGEDFLHLSLKMCLLSRAFDKAIWYFYVMQIHKNLLVCLCWSMLCTDFCDIDYTNWQHYKVNANTYCIFLLSYSHLYK
jgi:hypothetical protein